MTHDDAKTVLTDLTDQQWAILQPLIPLAKHGGRPREVEMRQVLNTLFDPNRTGCQWDLLPHDLLPKSTVYQYFRQWRDDGTWQRMMDCAADLRPSASIIRCHVPSSRHCRKYW